MVLKQNFYKPNLKKKRKIEKTKKVFFLKIVSTRDEEHGKVFRFTKCGKKIKMLDFFEKKSDLLQVFFVYYNINLLHVNVLHNINMCFFRFI